MELEPAAPSPFASNAPYTATNSSDGVASSMSGGGFDVGWTSANDARRAAGSRESNEKRVVDTL